MCLMCEHYYDSCSEEECVAAAKTRAQADRSLLEEYYQGRSGMELFLWKGYSDAPCEHIRADHGPECTVVKRTETEYGLLFDSCNCETYDEGLTWTYY